MPSPREDSFTELAGVPVHYDRDPGRYGSRGRPYTFKCRAKLHTTLDMCFSDLFKNHLPGGAPNLITSAGTIGDNENAHGKGLAFDLDGFFWDDKQLIMNDFFNQKYLYLGINAQLYLHFSQVLNAYYPRHHDHFHVDFNFSRRYRTESNAQTFFLQACLKYIYDEELGHHGEHRDGVDGVHGETTRRALVITLNELGLNGKGGLGKTAVWFDFLKQTRKRALDRVPHDLTEEIFASGKHDISDDFASALTAKELSNVNERRRIRRAVNEAVADEMNNPGANLPDTKISAFFPGPNGRNLWLDASRRIKTALSKKYKKLGYDDSFSGRYFNKIFDEYMIDTRNIIIKSETV